MNWKKVLPIIGIIIFVYILTKIDLYEVLNEVRNADLVYLLIALILAVVMIFSQTFKWHVIAIKQGIKIKFRESVKINLIANFYGFITPSKIGTILRAEYLKKYTSNIGKGLCNFTLDKIMDFSSLMFIVIVSSFIFREQFPNIPISYLMILFGLVILITIAFVNKKTGEIFLRIFYKRIIPAKMRKNARVTFDSFYENMPKKRYFLVFFILNILNWIVIYSISFFIGRALGIELSLIYFLAILPIGTIVSMIPISINGLGTREAVLISLFGLFGVSAAKVFSMSMIGLIITGIFPAVIASFFIFRRKE